MSEPVLSVVVALISGRKDDLARCLEALHAQEAPPAHEIIVPYDPPCAEVATLGERWPDVTFIAADMDTAAARAGASREHHDTLRTIGLKAARGRVVALTEDHAKASPTWCADMVRLLDDHPQVAAIGGAVECGGPRAVQRAVYFCDFGRYRNPLPEGPAPYVSDSNVAYRRAALEAIRDVWDDDYHETLVHDALNERGHELWLTPHSTVWQVREGLRWGGALGERYVWARSYAGTRVKAEGGARRLVFAVFSFLLPLLLTWRLLGGARAKGYLGEFVRVLPLVFVLQCAWAWGELVGYVTGNPGRA